MMNFIPDLFYENIYDIDYDYLKKIGIKCLIFDLDNTLESYKNDTPSKKLKELIKKLEKDFKLIILSNHTKDRVRPFKEILNIDSSFKSHKPFKKKYIKILNTYKYKENEYACIGDQLLTDILGANRMNFTSILVNPISPEEPLYTKFIRVFEKIIIKKLKKKGIDIKGGEL